MHLQGLVYIPYGEVVRSAGAHWRCGPSLVVRTYGPVPPAPRPPLRSRALR